MRSEQRERESVCVCVCALHARARVCTVELLQKRGLTTTSQSRPLVEEEAPFKALKNMGKNKSMVMHPNGNRNQTVFAGEG
jgi:hypothetical protein